jgi:DNA-binding transcriptional MerR regulator
MANKDIKDAATLNMKVIVKETGLKPDTLRAWEKRYGLPQPERTAGGHRLYSQRDIETIKWLITRQQEGLSISRAVELWQQLQADGQEPLLTMPIETAHPTQAVPSGATIEAIQEDWFRACMAFDEDKAEQILTYAFALYPPEQVCIQVLMKGLAQIGSGWYQGNITVQQEHFASELAIRRLETLISGNPPPTLQGHILVVCPPSEEHTFSPILISYLLGRNGRHAIFLGANLPVDRLEYTVSTIKPDLVILTAQQLHSAANLFLIAKTLRTMNIQSAYGGRIFNLIPEIRNRIPSLFLGESLEDVPASVHQFLNHSFPLNKVEDTSETYGEILLAYQTHLSEIESSVGSEMMNSGRSFFQLTTENTNMSQNIIASLTLGEIAFLGPEIQWNKDLFFNHNIPEENFITYIASYAKVISTHLGHEGKFISDFLISSLNMNTNSPTHAQIEHPS